MDRNRRRNRMEQKKVRNLSIFQYLQTLQIEYIVAELRRKIYIKKKDREYYTKVLDSKKVKITDICLRNSLPSIFTNEPTKEELYREVYKEYGYPNFHYSDRFDDREFRVKDFYHYYAKKTEFKVKSDTTFLNGTLVSVDQEKGVAVMKIRGQEGTKPVSLDSIARII